MINKLLSVHDLWLVLMASLVCANGSWASISLFDRATRTNGTRQAAWQVLTAIAAGTTVWCTHFVAILAFNPGVPVTFDTDLTMLSLLLAMLGAGLGFVIASMASGPAMPLIGGIGMGLAIAGMHYTGLRAYQVQGTEIWNLPRVMLSVLLAATCSAGALHFAVRSGRTSRLIASLLVGGALIGLHVLSIDALHIVPAAAPGGAMKPGTFQALAVAVTMGAIGVFGTALACNLIDDSTRAESYDKILKMALNDSLTNLPNRASFTQALERALQKAELTGGRLALATIDLDRFKEINDVWGHPAGDDALRLIAERMRACLRPGEFVARVGGDEFAAILHVPDQATLEDFLARIDAALKQPIRVDDRDVATGGSVGVAFYPENAASAQALIHNADLAMYRAKRDPMRRVCFYDREMDEAARLRKRLASDLRTALKQEEFTLHYQVQTAVPTGEICGYEALLRWYHPELGEIAPAEFIALAEENGLIVAIGDWSLRAACAEAATWNPPYKISVNLSPSQFVHPDLPEKIAAILAETGLDPPRLELELTEETIVVDKARALLTVRRIKAMGVTIALDDFGTGYSSLDTLRSFPFDRIKLDRSFVQDLETNPQATAIVRAVLSLGKSLNIPILAEGIETSGQLTILSAEGCDAVQGYFLGRPATPLQIVESGAIIRHAPLPA
ncbi:putative bifunctional diguanylate cyclase/phosphodiesterase [Nguyenibacter vanlangensis]|uniref:EAL domain-containing protein n=1 Tax=Nguyenibacter vanlangensis TaxID=1216886 RepID=A0A7Y7IWK9_9PROT|nr:EAL domain-containing protein [Nguyenibacter vanlangensis]NVN11517.1 EAL domain-containing protein [Nguyenibacter vanlangensis]